MSKIFIVKDCTKCPNFMPCTSPKEFRGGCTQLGSLDRLNLIDGFPMDCPLNNYEEPKTDVLDKIKAETEQIRKMYLDMNDIDWLNGCDYVLSVIDKYKAESEGIKWQR